jgi:hypothetical protein
MHWQVGRFPEHEKLNFSSTIKNDLNLWVRAASVALPVNLLSFDAKLKRDNAVHLDWEVSSESNNDFYTIERSSDGSKWNQLMRIDGAGNTNSLLAYSAIDRDPLKGTSYYRLKQTDLDGRFKYLQIRSIEAYDVKIEFYPNPVDDKLTILGSIDELRNISIYNLAGQEIILGDQSWSQDQGELVIDLSTLKTGIYFLKTKSGLQKIYKK